MVDVDRAAAGCAGPALPFHPDKPADTVLPDQCQVLNLAHVVFCTVAFVQLQYLPARELFTGITILSGPLPAGKNKTVHVVLPVR